MSSKVSYFSNGVENPDLGNVPILDVYHDRLVDIIPLALDPIEDFVYLLGEDVDKTLQKKEVVSILYALCKNAKALLTSFDDALVEHVGDVSVLKYCYNNSVDETPGKVMGAEIRQYSQEQEVTS